MQELPNKANQGRGKKLWEFYVEMPFRNLVTIVVALFFIGEWYPFSSFPMYSNFDDEATVLFIVDQNGEPLPVKALFRKGASFSKKMFNNRLKELCKGEGVEVDQASLEIRQEAGKWVLEKLLTLKREEDFPTSTAGVTQLQLQITRISLTDGDIEHDRSTLASVNL